MATTISHKDHGHPATPAARAACRTAANISLSIAVDALRGCSARSVVPHSEDWNRYANDHQDAVATHARLTNLTIEDATLKVARIVEMLPRAW